MARPYTSIPSTRWRNGLRFRPSAWSGAKHPLPRTALRTLQQLGDVAPDQFPPPWSLHLGIPDTLGTPEVRILANGFELYYAGMADPACVRCLMTPEGLWTGHATIELHPSLFSPELEVVEQTSATVVEKGGCATALVVKREGAGTRFCLCIDAASAPAAADGAQAGLSVPLGECWDRESALRTRFWDAHKGLDRDAEVVRTSLETLVYHLETTASGGLCSATGLPADAGSNINALHPLIQCWARIDGDVATRLLEDALQRIPGNGALPAARTAAGEPSPQAPWPMLLQTCARFEELVPGTDVVSRSLPALATYLVATINRMDPGHSGTPAWPSPEEGFIPDTHDANVTSASLTAMLLNEIEAFGALSATHRVPDLDDPLFDLEKDRLLSTLSIILWNDADGICHDRYVNGEPISRATLSGILPIGVAKLPEHIRTSLVHKASDPAFFAGNEGLRLWQYWETDDAPPPTPAAHQLFLLTALKRAGTTPVTSLEERCSQAISHWFDAHGALPIELQSGATEARDPAAPLWFESPVMAACLTLCTVPVVAQRKVDTAAPAYLLALDRHRYAILLGMVATIVGIVALSLLAERRKPTHITEDAVTIQLVSNSITQGEYTKAREQLQALKRSAEPPATLPLLEANLFFREGRYPEARGLYDQCIRDGIAAHKAAMNRALTYYREGRIDEAATQYQAAIDQFGEADPLLKNLAETAIQIIRVHGPELTIEIEGRLPTEELE